MLQCKACNGTYEPTTADGYQYFHVCPELSEAEARERLGLPRLPKALTAAQLEKLDRASRVRPGARNENVDRYKAAAAAKLSPELRAMLTPEDLMIAPGAGVQELEP